MAGKSLECQIALATKEYRKRFDELPPMEYLERSGLNRTEILEQLLFAIEEEEEIYEELLDVAV